MSFLFYSYAAHRLLHSFPTRRSSDLAHGVSHVPKYALPKSPRRPRPELRAVALPSNVPLSRAIFKLNSAWKDRKSTRLNSSHRCISYAVFCLKKKKKLKHE